MATDNTIGDRIRLLREAANLTQGEVAEGIGEKFGFSLKRETVNQWENGARDLKTDYTIMLAKFFNVTSDYLLGLVDTPTTNPSFRGAHEVTGLSQAAIELLAEMKQNAILGSYDEQYKTLSRLIENENFMKALQRIHQLEFNTLERGIGVESLPDCENSVEHHAEVIEDAYVYNGIRWEIADRINTAIDEILGVRG